MGSVPEKLLAHSADSIAIPSMVIYELQYGITRSTSPEKRTKQVAEVCSVFKILPFTDVEAAVAAKLRRDLELKGTPIGIFDVLIAATAVSNNGILITNNEKEFKRVAGLAIENWYSG